MSVCQYCGEPIDHGEFCKPPRMCKEVISDKQYKYIEILEKTKRADNNRKKIFIVRCKLCGQEFESIKAHNKQNLTGFIGLCGCSSMDATDIKNKLNAKNEFDMLSCRPRLENKSKLSQLTTLERDDTFSVVACMNCRLFETVKCGLTNVDLGNIDVREHVCELFVKWE